MTVKELNILPSWTCNQTIYEVNLRQYTASGTIREFRTHLPRLKALGVGILWFMPIQPIGLKNRKGSLGSYYSIRDYCEVDESYGALDEFRDLVREIHDMGMFVILDWVANHTAWDHHWVREQPGFYKRNEKGDVYPPFPDWADVIGLDYSNPAMRMQMVQSMRFWLRECSIDGFRCDMAHLVPTAFWEEARTELELERPGLYMLAETDHYELLKQAFHSSYDWKVFLALNEVAVGKISLNDLVSTIEEQLAWYPSHSSLMRFISNHDENSWQGSELERLAYFLEPFSVLYFTLPGIPLIYSGQEAGNSKRLSFFEKDQIEWKTDKMATLYATLTKLRFKHPALWSDGKHSGFRRILTSDRNQILAFERTRENSSVLVILNLGYEPSQFHLETETSASNYIDPLNQGMRVRLGERPCFEMHPFDYKVLCSED